MNTEKEMYVAERAAREAGRIMQDFQGREIEHSLKEDSTIVTEADWKCQEKIVEIISEEFPEDGFLGEENGLNPDDEERVWVIDPIDGTTNFFHGFPVYCTSIALRVGGEYVLGVIYDPVSGNMFVGDNEKALLNGERITVSATEKLSNSLISYSLGRGHIFSEKLEKQEIKFFERLESFGASLRDIGSGAVGMVYVAAGWADGFVVSLIHEWDFAGAVPIVRGAGGELTVRDSRFADSRFEVLATNKGISERMKKIFETSYPLEM